MPPSGATLPGRQARHTAALVAPSRWLCVPGGQGSHVALLLAPVTLE